VLCSPGSRRTDRGGSAHLLLAGDGLARTLATTRVRPGALPADGQACTVTTALVGADLDLATDVGGHLATEVALGLVVGLDPVTQGDELLVVQLVDTRVPADAGVLQGLQSAPKM
jgi:hypothetical protein